MGVCLLHYGVSFLLTGKHCLPTDVDRCGLDTWSLNGCVSFALWSELSVDWEALFADRCRQMWTRHVVFEWVCLLHYGVSFLLTGKHCLPTDVDRCGLDTWSLNGCVSFALWSELSVDWEALFADRCRQMWTRHVVFEWVCVFCIME